MCKFSAAGLFLVCLAFLFGANSSKPTPAEAAALTASALPAQSGNQANPAPSQVQATASPEASNANNTPAAVKTMQSEAANGSGTVLKVTTRLVMLDIVATDSNGHAILDLESTDFTVLEDGNPQKVRAFGLQHPPSSSLPSRPKVARPALPANVFTNIPQFQLNSSLNVILLDALNTPLTNQSYARQKMLHYLETMPVDSPTAVFTLGHKLRMLQDFSTDPDILKEAVKRASGQPSNLLDNSIREDEQTIDPPSFGDLTPEAQAAIERFEAERTSVQTGVRVRDTLDALQSIAHWLSGYQGRKNLIWISEAFPFAINPDVSVHSDVEFTGTENYLDDLSKTAELLTDSQVAIYPVDPRGLEGYSAFSAASAGTDRFGRNKSTRGPQFGNVQQQESSNHSADHDAMDVLADRTGGRAYYNRNDLDGAVREAVSDGSTYYMVGYYPENKEWNGKFRKIQVKVKRQGVKLRYRLGYYASDPAAYVKEDQKQRARELGDALNLDHPVSTALLFQAQVMLPSAPGKGNVTIVYAVDPHMLTMEHGEGGTEQADVECVVQAFDEKDKPVNGARHTVKAAMKPDLYQKVLKSGFPCMSEIALPAGSYLLRLAVRDNHTGLIGTANAKVNVPNLTETKAQ